MAATRINEPLRQDQQDSFRQNTFRQNTFLRGFTLGGDDSYRRDTTIGVGRTFTETVGFTYTSDEQWTKSLINQYAQIADKGVDGDMPLPAGFGRERRFWRMLMLSGFLGCIMGLIGCCFLNLADEGPKFWTNDLEKQVEQNPDAFDYWSGRKMWIVIVMGTGGVVGLLRFVLDFPENIAGIFKEINTYHVETSTAPKAVLLSVISLAGGATLGPEQALGTMGGGLGVLLLQVFPDLDEDDKKLLVLAGMTAAIGALFPAPLLSVLMMYELGHPPRTNMESVTILSFAAIAAFACYIAIVGTNKTWLRLTNTRGIILAADWEYQNWQLVTGFIIGIVSAGLSLISIILIGASKQLFGRIRMRLQRFKFLQSVIPPMIAGVLIGAFNYAMPMTVGNGNMVLPSIIKYGLTKQINSHQLITAGFARMFLLGISMNCVGFVGGFIFPTITIAIIAGVVCYQQFPGLPYGLCIGCFLAGVPSGICPMPFTLSCLAIFLFFFGFYQTAPILMSTITAYALVCGSGLFSAMRQRADEAEAAAKQAQAEAQAIANGTPLPPKIDPVAAQKAEAQRVAESTLSLAKYLQSKDSANEELPSSIPRGRSDIGIPSQDI